MSISSSYYRGYIKNDGSSSSKPPNPLKIRDYTVGVELDAVTVFGFEAYFGVTIDYDDILSSGISFSVGPAVGLNLGLSITGGAVREVEGYSATFDINKGIISPTLVWDNIEESLLNARWSGVLGGYGPGLGISFSVQMADTLTLRDMIDGYELVKQDINTGLNRFNEWIESFKNETIYRESIEDERYVTRRTINNDGSSSSGDSSSSETNQAFPGDYDLGADEYVSRFEDIANEVTDDLDDPPTENSSDDPSDE